jgi:threonine ammonia-lyase medium form
MPDKGGRRPASVPGVWPVYLPTVWAAGMMRSMPDLIDLHDIRAAATALTGRVHRTPLFSSRSLGERTGATASLKAECLQKTGSFKVRGALNRVRTLDAEAQRRGLVTVSAGNHAQALAWAAAADGVPCTVVMPETADPAKVEASRAYGAEVVLHGDVHDAFDECFRLRDTRGLFFVHPFDDPAIIAGQGTVGLEIVEDAPDVDVVVVPVGGGGLLSGIAAAVRALRPEARIYGVEPEGAAVLRRALDAGAVVRLDAVDTIADGLAPPSTGERTLAHAQALVDDVVLVSDAELVDAMRFTLERAKLLLEPAGAAAIAALLADRIPDVRDAGVVAVASGGNIGAERLVALLAPSGRAAGPR